MEPASVFVVVLAVRFCNVADALASIAFRAALFALVCANALPAKLRCTADAFGLLSVRPATEPTLLLVLFPAILALHR